MTESICSFLSRTQVEDLFPSLQLFHLQNGSLYPDRTNLLSTLSTPESKHVLTQQMHPDPTVKHKLFQHFHDLLQPKSLPQGKDLARKEQQQILEQLNSVCSLSRFLLYNIVYQLSFSTALIPVMVI